MPCLSLAARVRLPSSPQGLTRLGLVSALAFALFLTIPWLTLEPQAPREAPITDARQLERALREARDNCLVAGFLARGEPVESTPLFATAELRKALRTDLVVGGSYGELQAIDEEARWLAGLTKTSERHGRSWTDVAFLVGAIHWYLHGHAKQESTENHLDQTYDEATLREFRGLTFEDLVGMWD